MPCPEGLSRKGTASTTAKFKNSRKNRVFYAFDSNGLDGMEFIDSIE